MGHQLVEMMIDCVVIAGIVVVGVLSMAVLLYEYLVKKRNARLEQFIEDYISDRPIRYTYSEVKGIANGFKLKLEQGSYGTTYKGMFFDTPVAVKLLENIKGDKEEFINEVETIAKVHHVNVIRLMGYCVDGYRCALVYEYVENSSLKKYLSSGKTLSWEKLLNVALGIAKGLDGLHQGCSERIFHLDINPHNILIDHNLTPKLADFGLFKFCRSRSYRCGQVSCKSDVYSYGMLLHYMVLTKAELSGSKVHPISLRRGEI